MKKQQESLKNMVYQAILNGIFTDEYKPNQIINEQELVQKFGCSKTPIREALVTLCNEGILRSFPRFGYQVVSVSREEAQNILDFRLVLEGGYLRQLIGHITEENLAELAEIDERCKQSTDSVYGISSEINLLLRKCLCISGTRANHERLKTCLCSVLLADMVQRESGIGYCTSYRYHAEYSGKRSGENAELSERGSGGFLRVRKRNYIEKQSSAMI